MKIYTKTGDGGKTSLYSGKRVSKSNVRIHSYGALDELNCHIGLLRDQISNLEEFENKGKDLITIQSWIFSLGSHLANDSVDMVNSLPKVKSDWILVLEEKIDKMTSELIPLKKYQKMIKEIEAVEYKNLTHLKENVDKSYSFMELRMVLLSLNQEI